MGAFTDGTLSPHVINDYRISSKLQLEDLLKLH